MKYETTHQKYLDFIEEYKQASNAATGSEVDANANVEQKNVATMASEIHKKDNIKINRLAMQKMIRDMFGEDLANEYIRQLDAHEIYRHDESGLLFPYCVSVTMYPFLFHGMEKIGGCAKAPTHLSSFAGNFINLVFAISSQFLGAVSTPEVWLYLDYFIRKEYGDDYYLHVDKIVDDSNRHRTIYKVITDVFEQIVYSLNQPAAARGFQSVFWNVAYYDHPYFDGMFGDFIFPDGTKPIWESLSWLQKTFMKWFNKERLRAPLTFPVETLNLLDDGEKYVDEEWANFAAEMWSEGHSFFLYRSDSVDSLSSCCRLRNELQDNTFSYTLGAGGVSTGSKAVITMNINRLVQNAVRDGKDISEAVREQTRKIHKYLMAYNEIVRNFFNSRMLPVYDAGFISMEKQYLTIGINGFVEGAEFLGIKPCPNDQYFAYGEMILKPIYEENKKARTKELMFNTEFVPSL